MNDSTAPTGGAAAGSVVLTHPTWTVENVLDAVRRLDFDVDEPGLRQRQVLDTADARLHGAGVRLDVGDGSLRLRDGSRAIATDWPMGLRFAADLPAGPLRSRLAHLTDGRALLHVASFAASARDLRRRDKGGKSVVRGAIFEGLKVDGVSCDVGWMLELDPITGYSRPFDDVVADLVRAGCVLRRGDAFAVAAATVGVDLHPPILVVGRPLARQTPALTAVRSVLGDLWAAVEANWAGTIAAIDIEFLHDLRVALRRTRSVLGEVGEVLPPGTLDHFRGELRWLGAVTGRPRDLDVYVEEWSGYVVSLGPETAVYLTPVLDHLAIHLIAAHEELVEAMGSTRARRLRNEWGAWLAAPDLLTISPAFPGESIASTAESGAAPLHAGDPIGPMVAAWIRDAHRRVVRDGRKIGEASPAAALHDLRKRAKRLRYLIECFAGVLPAKRRKIFVGELKALQDNLGEHQDAEVHAAELREIAIEMDASRLAASSQRSERTATGAISAAIGADTLMALGQLREQLERRLRETRAEFAERFEAFDSTRVRTALDDLLKALDR